MEQITASHPLSKSAYIIKQNVDTLKSLFPTIVKEGKIDVEELKALLGEEVEASEEFYRFTWAGKSQARQEANKPSTGTLRPVKEESVEWDLTKNIFIEGDNLEALKVLQKSYANKIKLVYIDPPYNTGNDFVYKDNYADNLGNYLAISGQTDEEGKRLSTNTESDGRFHSNWLNMMYPRLKLARNLLKKDGIILISIDDNEVQNLRKVCDEIFGEENFVSTFIWKSRQNKDNRTLTGVSTDHEYVMCYVKDNTERRIKGSERKTEQYSNPDNDLRGPWVSANMVGLRDANSRPNLHYDLIDPETGINYGRPKMGWRYDSSTMNRLISEKRIIWPTSSDGRPRRKVFLSEIDENLPGYSSIIATNIFTRDGTREIDELFDTRIFDFPKPSELIKELIKQCCDGDDIVLDFFAGSGTTAQAVLQLNAEEDMSLRFFCIQLPEPLTKEGEGFRNGHKTISDISKERIRRAGQKIKSENRNELFAKEGATLDIGFRVFKLDSSNINAWDGSVQNFEQNLLSAAENIKPDRTEEDVLYEILLKSGLDLAQPIEEKTIAGKKVFNIGLGALFICLANDLTTAVAEGIGKWKQELEPATCRAIFKDTGFNDVEKTNSIQILKRYGINEVNTI